jgi:hypothetical protein
MGKKNGRKREREEDVDEEGQEIDLELEAELAALKSIQDEQNRQESEVNENQKLTAHKEGLLHCLESLATHNMPFIESMNICESELQVEDENDDLEREVCLLILDSDLMKVAH